MLLSGCDIIDSIAAYQCYNRNIYYHATHFDFKPNKTSPEWGFKVSDSNNEVDPVVLDETTANVAKCVQEEYPKMTIADLSTGYCNNPASLSIKQCLQVIVPPWHTSCLGEQVFTCSVPDASCEAKGETPTPECPCSCRSIIQGNSTIVTTPNLKIYPQELTELLTGCEWPYGVPIERCVGQEMIYKKE